MPVFKRGDLPQLTAAIAAGDIAPVYLVIGERFLRREAAAAIEAALLPEEGERRARLCVIDGEQENPLQTLTRLRTYSLFGGRQVIKVVDSRLLFSHNVSGNLWEKAEKARAAGEKEEAARLLRTMLGLAGLAPAAWQSDNLAELADPQWRKLFGFSKPADLGWAGELLADGAPAAPAAEPAPGGNADEAYLAALAAGLPPGNVLLLLAETADKRKKLYKLLDKEAVIVDLSVDPGGSAPARRERGALLKSLVDQTLAGLNKSLRPDALELLLERVGFQPVAAVMEAEKLALFAGERSTLTRADVDAMVGRTREEALFELSEAYSGGDLTQALAIMGRLQQGGLHPLAMISGLRNHVRKLMLARAIQDSADRPCDQRISFALFQKNYLPQVRENWERSPNPADPAAGKSWPAAFPGHPYALYQLFLQAGRLSAARLRAMLEDLLEAEYRLKGSGLPESAILGALLFAGRNPRSRAGGVAFSS